MTDMGPNKRRGSSSEPAPKCRQVWQAPPLTQFDTHFPRQPDPAGVILCWHRPAVRVQRSEGRHGLVRAHPGGRRPPRDSGPAGQVPGPAPVPGERRRERGQGAQGPRGERHRPRRTRHHDAGRGRPRAVPPPARDRRAAGHHADRDGRGHRPGDRARDGRRRLRGQAVQPARARRPGQGGAPARQQPAPTAPAGVRRRGPAPCGSTAGSSTSPSASWSARTASRSRSAPPSSSCSARCSTIRGWC